MSPPSLIRAAAFAATVCVLGMLGSVAGCGSGEPPRDVLLVTIDTLRADHLSVYGYARDTSPNLARHFPPDAAAVFDRAYAASAYTSASTASLLSGRLPQEHGVRLFDQLFPDDVPWLTGLLPADHQTAAFVSTKILSDTATGLASHFEYFDDRIEGSERIAGPTTDAVLDWLDTGRDPSRPLFLWVHYKDPHAPYDPPPSHRGRFRHAKKSGRSLDRVPPYARLEGAEDPLDYVDRYDEEIAYTDEQVGRLLDGYAERFDPERALVIVTADHGESLVERRFWFVHANHVFEEQVRVPLLVRGPGVVPGRRAGLVSGLDVLPTVLGFVGAPVPAELSGRDLRSGESPPDRAVFAESVHYLDGRQWRAAIQGDRKWTVVLERGDALVGRKREYDLASDPGERRALPWSEAEVSQRLLDLVHADPDPAGMPEEVEHGGLVDENPMLLKALGYAE
ncbi:MAG: sulfatase [Myxococcota bacterium]